MHKYLLIFVLVLFMGCREDEDPCELDMNAIECSTGDFDGDGVLNEEDLEPSDNCFPNLPAFEENIIGIWNFDIGIPGMLKINEDGTYENLEGEILFNKEIVSRTWRIESKRIIFDVENALVSFAWISYDCTSIKFNGEGFSPNFIFSRE